MKWLLPTVLAIVSQGLSAQAEPASIVDARINRYCHPPDECVLRGALLWDSTNVMPRYPEIMRSVGIESDGRVEFLVQPDGTVDRESVKVSALSNRAFEQPILDAVRRWRFRVAATDRPTGPIATSLDFSFAIVEGCPEGFDKPLHSLRAQRGPTRMLIVRCGDYAPARH
jgi:TonB family protein